MNNGARKHFLKQEGCLFEIHGRLEKPEHAVRDLKIQRWARYSVSTMLVDFFRYILAWKFKSILSACAVSHTLLMALASPELGHAQVQHYPSLLSNKGPCYISGELRTFLKDRQMEEPARSAPTIL